MKKLSTIITLLLTLAAVGLVSGTYWLGTQKLKEYKERINRKKEKEKKKKASLWWHAKEQRD